MMESLTTELQNWVKELRKMLGTDVALVIAGNKIDMEKNRTVSLEEAEAYVHIHHLY